MENVKLSPEDLAGMIDHTLLKPDALPEDFEKLCRESMEYHFKMVAINGAQAVRCSQLLKGSGVHVGVAVGFPLGQTTVESKVFETADALKNGADEIDYVINITELKSGNLPYLENEMRQIVSVCREKGAIVKVIFENCFLTDDEKKAMCGIACRVKPDFIKTSTGFGSGGATVEDVRLMKAAVGNEVKIKAAGGIRDVGTALALINAGARRIGTSSGVKIVNGYKALLNK
ncbi:MAG TPA: deoxyribose-phosphate aldolase [Ruminococcaceae bacterium]|nr:deoxyribose-phosphate aldolase [Oscillospiraceae bacterium]